MMIVAHVRFPVPGVDKKDFEKKMLATTPKYEKLDGLIRKYYIMTEDGKYAGGIYLWESKARAQAWYNDEWLKYMTEAWSEAPLLEYLDCPIVVEAARVDSKVAA